MAEVEYVVRGHWPFPEDMLRHDGSRPASPEDAALLAAHSAEYAPDRAVFRDVEIRLVGPNKPNTARWESFGWAIPADLEHAYYKRVAQEGKARRDLLESALGKLTPEERAVVEAAMGGGRS